jgi:isocitrate lyase
MARCTPTSRCTRWTRCPRWSSASTTPSPAPTRSSGPRAKARTTSTTSRPIVADAEAGFGGVLNAFELMKAMIDAGAAGVHFEDQLARQEVRPHGRQGAGAHHVKPCQAGRCPPGCRRDGHAHHPAGPHRRRSRRPGDQRRGRQRQALPDRRAHRRRLLQDQERPGAGHQPRPGLCRVRRPDLVRNRHARPGLRQASSPTPSTPSSRASCWPTTARRRSTGRRTWTTPPSPSSRRNWAPWATSSSSSRWPASTA